MFINIVKAEGFPRYEYLYVDNELKAEGLITPQHILQLLDEEQRISRTLESFGYKVEYFNCNGLEWESQLESFPNKYTDIPEEFLISEEV